MTKRAVSKLIPLLQRTEDLNGSSHSAYLYQEFVIYMQDHRNLNQAHVPNERWYIHVLGNTYYHSLEEALIAVATRFERKGMGII